MSGKALPLCVAASLIAGFGVLPAKAVHITQTENADGLRIELQVMPAEPFYTADQVRTDPELEGMLIMGGAKPLAPNAKPQPDPCRAQSKHYVEEGGQVQCGRCRQIWRRAGRS